MGIPSAIRNLSITMHRLESGSMPYARLSWYNLTLTILASFADSLILVPEDSMQAFDRASLLFLRG